MQQANTPQATRGFFTIAQDSGNNGYVRMAYALALSLKATQANHANLSIGVTPGYKVPDRYAWAFDKVIEIPWTDHAASSKWKLENEWKVIHMTPYDETIKLDADMLFFSDIGAWWDVLSLQDFVLCNRVLDYRARPVSNDYYRKVFTVNQLPDVYTAMFYFKKTKPAYEIFDMARFVYFNWQAFFTQLLKPEHCPDMVSTDVVFGLVLKLLDLDNTSYGERSLPTFTHMKSQLQGWNGVLDEDWQRHMETFFTPELEMKIGNYIQHFPLHYHRKDFLTDEMIGYYERQLGYE
jgi:hypothetical protein